MNFFQNLFPSSKKNSASFDDQGFAHVQTLFEENGEFFTHLPLFYQQQKHVIPYLMIHPQAGVVLFKFFNYSAKELDGVKAEAATAKDKNADIKTRDDKSFIELRFDAIFNMQIAPVFSVLICPNLSEGEFDYLDESFHTLLPKDAVLFNDSNNEHYLKTVLRYPDKKYDKNRIKQALFGEFVVPEQNILMSTEKQQLIHLPFDEDILIKALPGSGKSSLLIAKALYEKINNPSLELLILGKLSCNVHQLQILIFKFIENSHWSLNPADIPVVSFESLQKRARDKEHYDLIICDEINEADLGTIRKLLKKQGRLLASSSYDIDALRTYPLIENFRLPPALCAACEGLEVQKLNESLQLQSGNTFMNTMLILEKLLQTASASEIAIVHHNKEDLLKLQNNINSFFTQISFLYDDPYKQDALLLYPLSHLSCIHNDYVIIIVDEESRYDKIELISRAHIKSFILSESEAINHLIKGERNEPN